MYAIKVRPPTATAWFWLRQDAPLMLTTKRTRAIIGRLVSDPAAPVLGGRGMRDIALTVGRDNPAHEVRVVKLGAHL